MLIKVLDFETTGMPPDAAVCEAGWYDVAFGVGGDWVVGTGSTLVNPERPIPPAAMAIHHIRDAEVAEAPTAAVVFELLREGVDIFAAHNASFEAAFFDTGEKPWICTLKASRRVWPEAPGHSNQVLRYWRDLPLLQSAAMPPHRAQPDAYVTAWILRDLLHSGATIDDMVRWTKEPSLLPKVTFGKHRNQAWADLPVDYLNWLVNKSDMDADTKFTASHYLKLRDKQTRAMP